MNLTEIGLGIVGTLIAYIVSVNMVDRLITGTTMGDEILTMLIPIAIGAGGVLLILIRFLRGGTPSL